METDKNKPSWLKIKKKRQIFTKAREGNTTLQILPSFI